MAQAENDYRVDCDIVVVKRKVSRLASGYDELPQVVRRRSANQWMLREHFDSAGYQINRFQRGRRIIRQQELDEPLEIGKSGRRVDQPRQRLGFGFDAFLPAARALT